MVGGVWLRLHKPRLPGRHVSYACLPLISRDGLVLVRYQFYCQKVINVWSGFIWPCVFTTWLVRTIRAIFGVFRARFDHLKGVVTDYK